MLAQLLSTCYRKRSCHMTAEGIWNPTTDTPLDTQHARTESGRLS